MLKTFKTEIKPTRDQIIKIEKSIGVCRFLYNEYIRENIKSKKIKSLLLEMTLTNM